jgi:hypothetical protein
MNSIQHLPADAPSNKSMRLRLASLDPAALTDEILRLRALVGPDEHAFHELKLELWVARDLVVGKDAELGNARGHCKHLEREVHIRDLEINKLRAEIATIVAPRPSEVLIRKAKAKATRGLRP